jgi:outer membrane protein OmpA-like peptidoglycan-associated protein
VREDHVTFLRQLYACNQGVFDHNVGLSCWRAHAVVQALTNREGFGAGRIKPCGVGMTAPAAGNDSD